MPVVFIGGCGVHGRHPNAHPIVATRAPFRMENAPIINRRSVTVPPICHCMVQVMTPDEKTALKAACVQAAATLVAAWWPVIRTKDIDPSLAMQELEGNAVHCAMVAERIYTAVSGIDWKVKPKAAAGCNLPG